MASSSGNAMVAPTPRRNVRRGNDVLVMNIGRLLFVDEPLRGSLSPAGTARGSRRRRSALIRVPVSDQAHHCHLAARCTAGRSVASGVLLIWNGVLVAMPSTIAE